MAERSDVDDIGIARIDDDAADLLRIAQPDVPPSLAAVCGFVDTVARAERGANVRFTGAGVEHVRIRRRNFQRADGSDRLAIEDGLPGSAGIGGLPHPAIDRAEIKRSSTTRHAGDRNHTAAAKWPDQSPAQRAQKLRCDLGRSRNVQKKCRKSNTDKQGTTSYAISHSSDLLRKTLFPVCRYCFCGIFSEHSGCGPSRTAIFERVALAIDRAISRRPCGCGHRRAWWWNYVLFRLGRWRGVEDHRCRRYLAAHLRWPAGRFHRRVGSCAVE